MCSCYHTGFLREFPASASTSWEILCVIVSFEAERPDILLNCPMWIIQRKDLSLFHHPSFRQWAWTCWIFWERKHGESGRNYITSHQIWTLLCHSWMSSVLITVNRRDRNTSVNSLAWRPTAVATRRSCDRCDKTSRQEWAGVWSVTTHLSIEIYCHSRKIITIFMKFALTKIRGGWASSRPPGLGSRKHTHTPGTGAEERSAACLLISGAALSIEHELWGTMRNICADTSSHSSMWICVCGSIASQTWEEKQGDKWGKRESGSVGVYGSDRTLAVISGYLLG